MHGAVFQYLDDTGTTVSVLAERAQITKQAMAELVGHLEAHGYVTRVPDPADRRAKAIAQDLVPEVEQWVGTVLGTERAGALREDLETLWEALRQGGPGASGVVRS